MQYKEFKKLYAGSRQDITREIFHKNQKFIRIKKEKTAVNNLEKIFDAVFSITYKKGFQAMSMRDLSQKTGMSLGALYAYFPGKKKLFSIIQSQGDFMIKEMLEQFSNAHEDPLEKLKAVIKAHLFLSELFRPWFYFIFMEARNIEPAEFKVVSSMEKNTLKILTDILVLGEKQGIFKPGNQELTACMIKAMQQEWYLKRWKYRKMKVSVDQFTDHLINMVEDFCLVLEQPEPAKKQAE
ncbi:MAG: TetR/AcrR family transcriptional regulator [Thermodesulfobacteriota bacterium]|nr:TetR/AcrR family transcriptional regulator [Thermodesulfobacteriota bacterium]